MDAGRGMSVPCRRARSTRPSPAPHDKHDIDNTSAGPTMEPITRRSFLASTLSAGALAYPFIARGADAAAEPIIDIHQHTNYRGWTDAQLLAHQRAMGVT